MNKASRTPVLLVPPLQSRSVLPIRQAFGLPYLAPGKPRRLVAAMCSLPAPIPALRALVSNASFLAFVVAPMSATGAPAMAGALLLSNPTVGVTRTTLLGTVTPGALRTDETQLCPEGTTVWPDTTMRSFNV